MDTMHQIDEMLRRLHILKDSLHFEIDLLHKDIDHVENDTLGTMNKIKSLVTQHMTRSSGFEGAMGDAYSIKKHAEFNNAQDYIRHLKSNQERMRQVISKVENAISNVEKCKRDLSSQLSAIKIWMDKSEELFGK